MPNGMAMYSTVKAGCGASPERSGNNGQKPRKDKKMSTRAAIAMRLPDNTIHAIYCHNDGYPGWVGAILGGFYKTEEQVKALLALGALSQINQKLEPDPGVPHTFLEPQKGVTIAYHRDRGERLRPGKTYSSFEEYEKDAPETFCAEYLYLFEDGTWKFRQSNGDGEWTVLDVKVGEEQN